MNDGCHQAIAAVSYYKTDGRLILTGKLIQKSRIKCTCTTIKF